MKSLVLFYMTTCLLAGETGILKGKVLNIKTKDPLSTVYIIIDSTSFRTGTSTNLYGEYEIKLPTGTYTVTYSKIGYQTFALSNVVIKTDSVYTKDVLLLKGPIPGEELVLAVPGETFKFRVKNQLPSRFKMKVIKPDASIDYKIIQVVPDSTVDYKIMIVDPE
jgi:hypothetical protein